MSKAPKLDPRPARELTSRECAQILGGTIGALVQLADVDTVRDALRWWAETPDAFALFEVPNQ